MKKNITKIQYFVLAICLLTAGCNRQACSGPQPAKLYEALSFELQRHPEATASKENFLRQYDGLATAINGWHSSDICRNILDTIAYSKENDGVTSDKYINISNVSLDVMISRNNWSCVKEILCIYWVEHVAFQSLEESLALSADEPVDGLVVLINLWLSCDNQHIKNRVLVILTRCHFETIGWNDQPISAANLEELQKFLLQRKNQCVYNPNYSFGYDYASLPEEGTGNGLLLLK